MGAHSGQLFVEGSRHGLDAVVTLDAKNLRVATDDSTWKWSIADVTVSRWDGSRFKLLLRTEELIFKADQPLSFNFEIVDRLSEFKKRRTSALRRPAGRRQATGPAPSGTRARRVESAPTATSCWTLGRVD